MFLRNGVDFQPLFYSNGVDFQPLFSHTAAPAISRKRHHDASFPPQTWRKRLFVAAQSCSAAFHPSATWRTQFLRVFHHASGKFSPQRGS